MQKLWRSRRELSLLIYSESVTNNSVRNTGENTKWYSQLPNTISISQIHPKRNLRRKIDYKHKQVKATLQVMIGRAWNGSVSFTITCSSVKMVNFEFYCIYCYCILCKNCDSLEILQFSPFCAPTFSNVMGISVFCLSATTEHLTLFQNSLHRI